MRLASEIIKNEACKAGFNPDDYYAKISKFIEDQKAFILRNMDTILLVKLIGGKNAELHLFTEDSPIIIAKSIKKFWADLIKADIKTVYGQAENDQIVKLMKVVRAPIEDSDRSPYNWKANIG